METAQPQQPQAIHTPGWHEHHRTPVIDNKYYDPKTGELCVASGQFEYLGPPAVDIIVSSMHEDTSHCKYRAARPFAVEAVLCNVMRVVAEHKLEIDSLNATPYAVRIMLCNEMTVEQFNEVAIEMANGVFGPES